MIILAHKIRGHHVEPFKVLDSRRPWRWQCSCGKVFGGGAPFRQAVQAPAQATPITIPPREAESIIESKIDLVKTMEEVRTDIIKTVESKAPDADSGRPKEDGGTSRERGEEWIE